MRTKNYFLSQPRPLTPGSEHPAWSSFTPTPHPSHLCCMQRHPHIHRKTGLGWQDIESCSLPFSSSSCGHSTQANHPILLMLPIWFLPDPQRCPICICSDDGSPPISARRCLDTELIHSRLLCCALCTQIHLSEPV